MLPSARMFHCARCHCQVMVCRRCDRGQVYCPGGCAEQARTASMRRAGKRYRATRGARHANADRQRRFRARQREKVTHHGSAGRERLAVLHRARKNPRPLLHQRTDTAIFCHVCLRECDPFVRRDFLRPAQRGAAHRTR